MSKRAGKWERGQKEKSHHGHSEGRCRRSRRAKSCDSFYVVSESDRERQRYAIAYRDKIAQQIKARRAERNKDKHLKQMKKRRERIMAEISEYGEW